MPVKSSTGVPTMRPSKSLDYAFRSLHATAEMAKSIIRAYYGTEIGRSYFKGCSTSGRQALILVQRFPKDFCRFVANVPSGSTALL